MRIDDYKERLIAEGIESVCKHEKRPEWRRGGVAGFEACRGFNTMSDFQEELKRRQWHEANLISLRVLGEEKRAEMQAEGVPVPQGPCRGTLEEYWEYRCATAQIEYVYQRMLVAGHQLGLYSGPVGRGDGTKLKQRASRERG